VIGELKKIVGDGNVSDDPMHLLVYSFDASMLEGKAAVVVWAENAEQVSKILKLASEKKFAVVPRGAATNLTGGVIPDGGVILDLSRMNKILEEGDDYVVCEPGVVLEELESRLAKNKKTFPVMPGSDKAAQVGGCIAEDAAGIRAIKYGTMRDWVEEMQVVLPSGEVTVTSDKKFFGSEGTLGVVTRAKLKIIAKPKRTVTLIKAGSYEDVQKRVIELAGKQVSALEFIGDVANSLVDEPLGVGNFLLVEYEGERGDVTDPAAVASLHERRKKVSTQLAQKGYFIVEDPRVPHEKIAEFLAKLKGLGLPSYGHVGYGIIHARGKTLEEAQKIIDLAVSLGADPASEHGVGLLKKKFAPKKWIAAEKEKLDPNNILNPGKAFGEGAVPAPKLLETCAACGICRNRCPVFKQLLDELASPRGKALLVEKNKIDEAFLKCSLCGACEAVCPMGAKLLDEFRKARTNLIKEGKESEAGRKMIANVRKHGNPFGSVIAGEKPKDLYCC